MIIGGILGIVFMNNIGKKLDSEYNINILCPVTVSK
jgi:hypothetical protein